MTGPEYVQNYRERLDEIKQRADGAANSLSGITASASSSDEAVSVTVNPNGGIEDLQLGKATERMSAEQLRKLIMDTMRQAQAEAGKKVEEAMRPLLGESEGMDLLRSHMAKPPETDEEPEAPVNPSQRPGSQRQDEAEPEDDNEGFRGFDW